MRVLIISSSLDPANEAYESAVEHFKAQLTHDECKRIWLKDKNSIQDVVSAVDSAKAHYESKKQSKARKWLTRLSSRVSFYGGALDKMAEISPEYVGLVWGALKFLLRV